MLIYFFSDMLAQNNMAATSKNKIVVHYNILFTVILCVYSIQVKRLANVNCKAILMFSGQQGGKREGYVGSHGHVGWGILRAVVSNEKHTEYLYTVFH